MGGQSKRDKMTGMVVRPGEMAVEEAPHLATPSERIEAVWELTRLCMAWTEDASGEPRLQRSVSRVQRTGS